jgi:excisionase family DNA binding protein
MTFAEAPDVLTIAEAAKLARVGERQMREAVRDGRIYGARLGRSIRISKHALARWLEGEKANGEQPRPLLAVVGGAGASRRDPSRA